MIPEGFWDFTGILDIFEKLLEVLCGVLLSSLVVLCTQSVLCILVSVLYLGTEFLKGTEKLLYLWSTRIGECAWGSAVNSTLSTK
jgi:hypothetical protein